MRHIFQKKSLTRIDLIDAQSKRPMYTLQTYNILFGCRAVLSRCSQNNDGDEDNDEVDETTIRDISSNRIVVGNVKHVAKEWLHQDGSKWTFTAVSGAHYIWSSAEDDLLLQGPGGLSELARLHTDKIDSVNAYLDFSLPRQDEDEVLMSCVYLRLRDAKLADSVDGRTLINAILVAGPHKGNDLSARP
ncbi:unnamed protein product [Peniophora sp. CBMAI 1063]|nr:unnamed protein product [Peniophora sp. CBMAI 1063]